MAIIQSINLQKLLATMKKVLEEMQILCTCHSNAEPKNFTLPQTPFPGVQDGQNFISWRRSTTFT